MRVAGPVSRALAEATPGGVVGVRGPYGTPWPLEEAADRDVVIVAGGLGLPPLRPLLYELLRQRPRFGRLELIYGARTPKDLVFYDEIQHWRTRNDLRFQTTVDTAGRDWYGDVGLVTARLPDARFEASKTVAFLCGPEIMMKLTAQALLARGVPPTAIWLSMERNMKCAVGLCGHCQFGPAFVCRDGPVFRYSGGRPVPRRSGSSRMAATRPTLAVFKFASCDGCQLTLLDCEDELLPLADRVEIVDFREASSAVRAGPYDLALVEGSVTTARATSSGSERSGRTPESSSPSGRARRRAGSRPCGTSRTSAEFRRVVYARPEFIATLATLDARSRTTCRSTSSSGAARSTRSSSSR